MSQFVGAALPQSIVIADDFRHHAVRMRTAWAEVGYVELNPWSVSIEGEFYNAYWPGNSDISNGSAGDQDIGVLGGQGPRGSTYFEPPEYTAGARARYVFTGITRDANGSPLGSCNVYLYHTSDGIQVDSSTSDPSGNFRVTTPYYPDTHFIVCYKSATPDVFGTSPNTLIANG